MKKVLAVFLILMTTGSIVACGGAKKTPNETSSEETVKIEGEGVKADTTEKITDSVQGIISNFEKYFDGKEIKKEDISEGEIAKEDHFVVEEEEQNGFKKTVELFMVENNGVVSPRVDVSFSITLADMKEGKISELNKGEFEKYNKIFGQDYTIDYAKVNEDMKKIYSELTEDSFEVPYTVEMADGYKIYFTFAQSKITYSIQGATLVVQE